MNRRGWTFDDLWAIALVAVVLATGWLLWVGPPDVQFGRPAGADAATAETWACAAQAVRTGGREPVCGGRYGSLIEGRAIGRRSMETFERDMLGR